MKEGKTISRKKLYEGRTIWSKDGMKEGLYEGRKEGRTI
jgi:hypothetical protein